MLVTFDVFLYIAESLSSPKSETESGATTLSAADWYIDAFTLASVSSKHEPGVHEKISAGIITKNAENILTSRFLISLLHRPKVRNYRGERLEGETLSLTSIYSNTMEVIDFKALRRYGFRALGLYGFTGLATVKEDGSSFKPP